MQLHYVVMSVYKINEGFSSYLRVINFDILVIWQIIYIIYAYFQGAVRWSVLALTSCDSIEDKS